jgi:hypothetical protein
MASWLLPLADLLLSKMHRCLRAIVSSERDNTATLAHTALHTDRYRFHACCKAQLVASECVHARARAPQVNLLKCVPVGAELLGEGQCEQDVTYVDGVTLVAAATSLASARQLVASLGGRGWRFFPSSQEAPRVIPSGAHERAEGDAA